MDGAIAQDCANAQTETVQLATDFIVLFSFSLRAIGVNARMNNWP
jgi:hypothetical protein